MPNVGTDTTESPKRAPRKRAVRRVVSSTTSPARKPRATTRASSTVARSTTARTSTTARKAPTVMSESTAGKKSPKKYIIIGVALVVFISAAWIGSSDSGAIDVNAKLTEKRQKDADNVASNDGINPETGEVVIPVQEVPAAALNLRGRGVGTANVSQQPEAPVEEVATSTEETATTTEEVTEESPENSEPEPEADAPVEETPVVGQ